MNLNKHLKNSIDCLDGPLHDIDYLKSKFHETNQRDNFVVKEIGISNLKSWSFDDNNILAHDSGRFFKVLGIEGKDYKSGILLQNEIGTLGLITCMYDEVLHMLVQFKKEPGNILPAQLSPTLQATLSNQNKVHGGSAPKYLEYFEDKQQKKIISKLLPEQGFRYWQKYNKNTIIKTNYFKEDENFYWMTLGQIYEFSSIDNSINSCLRSVLSLLNFDSTDIPTHKYNKVMKVIDSEKKQNINNFKLIESIINSYDRSNDVLFFDTDIDKFFLKGISISIENREVGEWDQPIIYDPFIKQYGLVSFIENNKRKYLLKLNFEPGYEFGFSLGPSFIKREYDKTDFLKELKNKIGENSSFKLIKNINMSEEGGRFYNLEINHSFYDVDCLNAEKVKKGFYIFDEDEVQIINELGFLSMEARSLMFFANSVYN